MPSDPHGPALKVPNVKAYYVLVPLPDGRGLVFSVKQRPGDLETEKSLQELLSTVKFKKSKRR
jgi:hypothetical protein